MPTIAVSYSPLVKKPIHEFKVGQFYNSVLDGTDNLHMVVSVYTEDYHSNPSKFCMVNINTGIGFIPVSNIQDVLGGWHESLFELVKDPFTVTVTP